MTTQKYLCVMSDDFGMHPAMNAGIVQAFVEGLLTDSNLMAPCPAFAEAVALAHAHHIPVGLHATFTCDWDRYHWGPLTPAPSLVTPEGWLKPLVEEAWSRADEAEALDELRAQYQAIMGAGLAVTHVGEHMGVDENGKCLRVLSAFTQVTNSRVPHKGTWTQYADGMPHYRFNSTFSTSAYSINLPKTKAWLRSVIFSLTPGYHLWLVHAALDHPSLDEICTPDFHAVHWARTFRAIDQALLLDPEVKDWLERLDIQRVPLTDVPRA
jgi:predicted glycoside hydrolase/deacetylase ChbG (UPF0249 family)